MKFFNLKKIIFIVFIIIIPLIVVNIENQTIKKNFLFRAGAGAIRSIQMIYFNYSSSIVQTLSHFTLLLKVKDNNQTLKRENEQLKIQLQQMKQLETENRQFKQMLDFQKQSPFHLAPAQIISIDPFPAYRSAVINKGSEDGIEKNKLAVVESGVAGYVLSTKKHTSQILFLVDPSAVLPVMIERSRVNGLIEGGADLKLNYLQLKDDVQKGDRVVTSSLVPELPSGLPVGVVTEIKISEYKLNKSARVDPLVRFSELKELFIVLPKLP